MKSLYYALAVALCFAGCNTYEDELNEAPVLEGSAAAGAAVYETYSCAGCHGADGGTMALGVSRIIANMDDPRDVENALFALQAPESERNGAMKSVAATLNSQEIVDVSVYIANEL